MWNPLAGLFEKKYYCRICTDINQSWTHELLEVQYLLTPRVFRGITFYEPGYQSVSLFNHRGEAGSLEQLWDDPLSGTMTRISKVQFDMFWNMYSVTDK